jgi:hypothetical protein
VKFVRPSVQKKTTTGSTKTLTPIHHGTQFHIPDASDFKVDHSIGSLWLRILPSVGNSPDFANTIFHSSDIMSVCVHCVLLDTIGYPRYIFYRQGMFDCAVVSAIDTQVLELCRLFCHYYVMLCGLVGCY